MLVEINLTGKSAIVTGSGSGIGREMARLLAHAILFLATDMSAYVTGQILSVSGGYGTVG